MRISRTIMCALVGIMVAALLLPAGTRAQNSESVPGFTQEELVQMLAPIALYPDSLVARILMASTYPLEVVEAERWVRLHPDLNDDALDEALQEMNWDPSVKSLCHFPDVLFAMSDKLDQTRKLGDAYLVQQDAVMDAIQLLRRRAREQGNLRSSSELKVVYDTSYIKIEPVDPQVVYVPVYNPLYVYGPWWYPAYPPWHWYYPPHVVVTGPHIVFGPRIVIGLGLFSWCWFDWPTHHIYVHYDRLPYVHGHYGSPHPGRHYWTHNPIHRRGVAYRDSRTSVRYGGRRPEHSSWDREKRGYPPGTHESRVNEPRRDATQEQRRSVDSQRNAPSDKGRGGTTRDYSPAGTSVSSKQRNQERQRSIEPSRDTSSGKSRSGTSRDSSSTRKAVSSHGDQVERTRTVTPTWSGRETDRSRSGTTRGSSSSRESSFKGIGNGYYERKASERGAQSRSGGSTYGIGNTGSRTTSPGNGSNQRDIGRGGGGHRR